MLREYQMAHRRKYCCARVLGAIHSARLGLPTKNVADAAHRLDQARVRGVFLQFLAEPADMDIHGACVADVIVTPDVMQQLVAGENCPTVAHEIREQLELLGL